jgi:hypothetical protein
MSPRQPNEYDVFNFIDMQKKQLVAGYDILVSPECAYGRQVALNGMLIALGSFSEALILLCELNCSFIQVQDQYDDDLKRWVRLRHDVAHIFDRVFGPARKGANSPWIPNGICVAVYTKANDTVRTGNAESGAIVLWDAIGKTFEISSLIELIHHKTPKHQYNEYRQPIADQIIEVQTELRRERDSLRVGNIQ